MNGLRKTALKLVRKKRKLTGTKKSLSKLEQKIIKTYHFSKRNNLEVFYKNIDFLTIWIERKDFTEKLEKLTKVCSYDDISNANNSLTDILLKFPIVRITDKFFFVFSGLTFNNKKQIYSLYDYDRNKIGQIVLRNEEQIKSSEKNIKNQIELSGLFFKCYQDYLNEFLDKLEVNRYEQDIIGRIDYCVDFKGLEVFKIVKYVSDRVKKTVKVYNDLPRADRKKLMREKNAEVKYGNQTVGLAIKGSRQDFKVYDKTLDIVENYLKRKVDGKNPHAEYIKSNSPIFRIEVKRKSASMTDLKDNSLNYFFENLEALFFDYIKRYFDIDLSYFVANLKKVDRSKNFLAQDVKYKKLERTLKMFKAYGETLKLWGGNKFLKKKFADIFPEADKMSYFEALPQEMLEDFLQLPTDKMDANDFLEKDFMYIDTSDKLIINT
ncbi:MAG: hypothetical protein N4A38_03805 [Candidatus Gracilibacteria bacterium]|nr:hypothetical protein [Candidatus Gracilibacteria bacterium]